MLLFLKPSQPLQWVLPSRGHHPTSLLFHGNEYVSQQNFKILSGQSHVLPYLNSSYLNTLGNYSSLNTFELHLLKYFCITVIAQIFAVHLIQNLE